MKTLVNDSLVIKERWMVKRREKGYHPPIYKLEGIKISSPLRLSA
jgi:hypothetical protein